MQYGANETQGFVVYYARNLSSPCVPNDVSFNFGLICNLPFKRMFLLIFPVLPIFLFSVFFNTWNDKWLLPDQTVSTISKEGNFRCVTPYYRSLDFRIPGTFCLNDLFASLSALRWELRGTSLPTGAFNSTSAENLVTLVLFQSTVTPLYLRDDHAISRVKYSHDWPSLRFYKFRSDAYYSRKRKVSLHNNIMYVHL